MDVQGARGQWRKNIGVNWLLLFFSTSGAFGQYPHLRGQSDLGVCQPDHGSFRSWQDAGAIPLQATHPTDHLPLRALARQRLGAWAHPRYTGGAGQLPGVGRVRKKLELFSENATYSRLVSLVANGATIRTTRLTGAFAIDNCRETTVTASRDSMRLTRRGKSISIRLHMNLRLRPTGRLSA